MISCRFSAIAPLRDPRLWPRAAEIIRILRRAGNVKYNRAYCAYPRTTQYSGSDACRLDEWGLGVGPLAPSKSQELFEEAARFGIRYGFTIPIHNNSGPVAAVTFAADERRPQFERTIGEHARVLQLMAMYFHAHVQRRIGNDQLITGAPLSPREAECLEWASQGKSAWEIGTILGISRHTVATYLENAKTKLGVRTIVQAVARATASKLMRQ